MPTPPEQNYCMCIFPRLFVLFSFFFSSRRRHTRCLSDWSSDVCSSDLEGAGVRLTRQLLEGINYEEIVNEVNRSEERRVGKECRSRGSRYDEKKTKERTVQNAARVMLAGTQDELTSRGVVR